MANSTKSKYQGKNKKYNNRGKGKDKYERRALDPKMDSDQLSRTDNDIAWYVPNAQVLTDVASLPFNQILGLPFNIGTASPTSPLSADVTIPGIMRLEWAPTWGVNKGGSSAINVAARNIYAFIRSKNSGASNYEPADLMMYFMAADGAYTFIHECIRAYGVAQYYLYTNRYLAKALLTTLGFEPDQILTGLAQFRYDINQMILKFNQINIPNVMPIFQRRKFLASHVFMDAPTLKAQLYAFCSAGFNKLREMEESAIGTSEITLEYYKPVSQYGEGNVPWAGIVPAFARAMFDDLFNKLIEGGQFGLMSGDVAKAYGEENCLRIDILPTDYKVTPVYNAEILPQIQNFRAMGELYPARSETIAGVEHPVYTVAMQDPGTGIISSGIQTRLPNIGGSSGVGERVPFNLRVDNPSPADVMIASRFCNGVKTIGGAVSATGKALATVSNGTEVGVTCHIVVLDSNTTAGTSGDLNHFHYPPNMRIYSFDKTGVPILTYDHILEDLGNVNATEYEARMDLYNGWLQAYSNFDWAPLVEVGRWTKSGTAAVWQTDGILGDLDNVVSVDVDVLERMHEAAILNELGVPYNGLHHV